MTLPRGLRNNNPLNIREAKGGGDQWVGESVVESDDSFEEFTHAKYGYRAAAKVLASYRNRGIVTVQGIINEWAPASENNAGAYLSHVLKRTGWQSNYVVESISSDLVPLLHAMAVHENGSQHLFHPALSLSSVEEGVLLAWS